MTINVTPSEGIREVVGINVGVWEWRAKVVTHPMFFKDKVLVVTLRLRGDGFPAGSERRQQHKKHYWKDSCRRHDDRVNKIAVILRQVLLRSKEPPQCKIMIWYLVNEPLDAVHAL